VEHPAEPTRQADPVPPVQRNGIDLTDPSLHAALYEGRVPDEVSRSIDAMIEHAAARRGR